MRKNITDYVTQFNNTLNFSDISWWVIDYEYEPGYFYCNELMAETFGLDKNALKHSVADTCPIAGDYIKNVQLASTNQANIIITEYLELIHQARKEYNNTFPYFDSKTNCVKYFSSRARALEVDEEGNVSVLFGIIENITSRVCQEKEIEEYHSIIDKNVITSTTDLSGTILSISEAFCEISGYTKEELIGQNHSILRHPQTKNDLYENMWKTISSGHRWEGEFKNKKKNGDAYWIKAIITPNFDENKQIKGYTTVNHDITDKKTIEKLSNKDKLTNVYNRAKLDSILEKEVHRFKRYGTDLSIVMLDIDHFKHVNDTFGHLTGDKVLIEIANLLKEQTRSTDYIGRWGGEEFLIICANSNIDQASKVAYKLKTKIEEFNFDVDLTITGSFGVTQYKKGDTIDEMLQRADNALYLCKKTGRNKVKTQD